MGEKVMNYVLLLWVAYGCDDVQYLYLPGVVNGVSAFALLNGYGVGVWAWGWGCDYSPALCRYTDGYGVGVGEGNV